MKHKAIYLLLAALALMGCAGAARAEYPRDDAKPLYTMIDQEEAGRRMALDDGHVVVDVRRQDEYEAGHIPGAILIPNESIGEERPAALPDLDQIILLYCRSGRRSKEAAQKLGELGYTRLYEFGGIITWTGDLVAGPLPMPEEDQPVSDMAP